MYRRVLPAALAAFILTIHVHPSRAEDAPQSGTLDAMVVTATRTEKNVDDVPASVTVITKEDIKAQHITTVDDALKHTEGVHVQRQKGLADSIPTVELRGLPGQGRTLIMVDGLPVNDGYSGGVYWNSLATDNIERIEVIRGPASALYGGNAMGGVVNIITRMPQKFEGGMRVGGGTNDTVGGVSWVGDRVGDISYRLGVEGTSTQGYPSVLVNKTMKSGTSSNTGGYATETVSGDRWTVGDKGDNAAKRYNVNTAFEWYLPENGSLHFYFMRGMFNYYYKSPHTYVNNSAGNDVWNGNTSAGTGSVSSNFKTGDFLSGMGGELIHRGAVTFRKDIEGTEVIAKTGMAYAENWYTTPKSSKPSQGYHSIPGVYTPSDRFSWFTDLQASRAVTDNHILTSGLYFRRDTFEQKEKSMSDYSDTNTAGDILSRTEGKMHQYAAFVQDEWFITDTFTLTPGLRFDAWQGFDGKSGKVDAMKSLDDASAWAVSPKIAALWKVLPDTSFRASYGKAFRPPNIYDMYRDWRADSGTYYFSNPDLDPETVWTGEIGVDQYLFDRTLKASLTYFRSTLHDAISNKTISASSSASGNTENYKVNIDEARIQGIEASLRWTPVEWLEIATNYTRNDTKVVKNAVNPAIEGNHLEDVPSDIYNVTVTTKYKDVTWSLAGTRIGRIYTDQDNNEEPDVYGGYSRKFVVDTRVVYEPDEHWMLALNVDNMFNEKLYSGSSISPGRTFFFEVGYNF